MPWITCSESTDTSIDTDSTQRASKPTVSEDKYQNEDQDKDEHDMEDLLSDKPVTQTLDKATSRQDGIRFRRRVARGQVLTCSSPRPPVDKGPKAQ